MKFARIILASLMTAVMTCGAAAHEAKLEGTEWGVLGDQGDKTRFISFAGSGRIFGFGGCNRFSGTFEQHDAHLSISPLAATRMACAPDVMAKETEFFDMLSKVRGVKVDHTVLLLLDESGADLKALARRGGNTGTTEE